MTPLSPGRSKPGFATMLLGQLKQISFSIYKMKGIDEMMSKITSISNFLQAVMTIFFSTITIAIFTWYRVHAKCKGLLKYAQVGLPGWLG